MTHGTRQTYQYGPCRCVPCRAANAAYQQALYQLRAKGQRPFGSLIDTEQVQRLVDGMLIEHFTFTEIARRIGLKCQRFRLYSDKVTIRKYLQVRRLYQQTMTEAPKLTKPSGTADAGA